MTASSPTVVPYVFVRECPPSDDPWVTRLPFVAFVERHQSRWSPYWEDHHLQMTALDFNIVLRGAYITRAGTDEQARLVAAGERVAEALMAAEEAWGGEEAVAVADCERMIGGWPSFGAPGRVPLFVGAHGFDAWNWRERVWRQMRSCPVQFRPLPDGHDVLLDQWLFGRYRLPRAPDRFAAGLDRADSEAKRSNSPRRLVAVGVREAMRNAVGLIDAADRLLG